ncbi:MAG: hypothetical protein R3F15_15625 [Lysobacterales bacterium]
MHQRRVAVQIVGRITSHRWPQPRAAVGMHDQLAIPVARQRDQHKGTVGIARLTAVGDGRERGWAGYRGEGPIFRRSQSDLRNGHSTQQAGNE